MDPKYRLVLPEAIRRTIGVSDSQVGLCFSVEKVENGSVLLRISRPSGNEVLLPYSRNIQEVADSSGVS